ncbi:Hypothetical protein NTJ_05063 [Nesidiocoris tenuis]|uniref:Uncharacterized protein n=1 Tax=Nesidiocoris tenuis TaxID=355587 RepID=A0ABN7ALF8_9HEMI|nr:Hypothetical protein NTJ_05063 [Nesidiocoris tenuis]
MPLSRSKEVKLLSNYYYDHYLFNIFRNRRRKQPWPRKRKNRSLERIPTQGIATHYNRRNKLLTGEEKSSKQNDPVVPGRVAMAGNSTRILRLLRLSELPSFSRKPNNKTIHEYLKACETA